MTAAAKPTDMSRFRRSELKFILAQGDDVCSPSAASHSLFRPRAAALQHGEHQSRGKLSITLTGAQRSVLPAGNNPSGALRAGTPMAHSAVPGQGIGLPGLSRKLLTILAADVVGYSRLTEAAEEDTHARLRALRVEIIDPAVVTLRGRIIRNTGDGFLAAFDSTLDAVRCAIEVQRDVAASESAESPDRKIIFRMGLNVDDVIIEPEDIYGGGVNIAARLEPFAPPGGIIVSAAVFKQVSTRIDTAADDLGELRLKNISRPVRAYSLAVPGADRRAIAGARKRATKRAKVPSIAVLPFRNEGEDGADSYFGEGMVEDIIVALSSIRGLLVISRTSALSFRRAEIDIQKIGQELGIRYILSGSVRRTTSQLRIVAELADVETSSVIWADRYEGDLAELFDFQERIATRIVWSVAPNVREAELKRAVRKRPSSLNAYDFVMQAINLMYRMNFGEFEQAGSLFQQAIEADQDYSTAYAYAALWRIHNIAQGWTNDQRADSIEAARLAAAAVDRDPTDGFALAVHGHTKSFLFREYDEAIAIFERALAAAPGNAMAWSLSSGPRSYSGDGKNAIARAEHGLRLSPIDTQTHFYVSFLAIAHYVSGSYDEATIWARKALGLNPHLCASLRLLIVSLAGKGELAEARHVAKALMSAQPRFSLASYARLCPYREDIRVGFLDRLRMAGLPD
jgi:TolB-like protein/Flp pilus assembly protein TadD